MYVAFSSPVKPSSLLRGQMPIGYRDASLLFYRCEPFVCDLFDCQTNLSSLLQCVQFKTDSQSDLKNINVLVGNLMRHMASKEE